MDQPRRCAPEAGRPAAGPGSPARPAASARQAQQRANLKLALVLASVALAFGLGFVARLVLWAH